MVNRFKRTVNGFNPTVNGFNPTVNGFNRTVSTTINRQKEAENVITSLLLMSSEEKMPWISIAIEDRRLYKLSLDCELKTSFDREEAQGLIDLVENYLHEKYPKRYKEEDFHPHGVRIVVVTNYFEKRCMLSYTPTTAEAIEILVKVCDYLKSVLGIVEIVKQAFSDEESEYANQI